MNLPSGNKKSMPALLCCLGILLFSLELSAGQGVCAETTDQITKEVEVDPVTFFAEDNFLAPPEKKGDYRAIAENTSTRHGRLQAHLTELEELHTKTREDARKPNSVKRGEYAISDLERLPRGQRNRRLGVRLSQSAEALREIHTGLQKGALNLLEIGDVANYWGENTAKLNGDESAARQHLSLVVERNENLIEQLHTIELEIRENVAKRVSGGDLAKVKALQKSLDDLDSHLVDMKVDLGIVDSKVMLAGHQSVKPVASQRPLSSRFDEWRRDPNTPGRVIGKLTLSGILSLLGWGGTAWYSSYAYEAEEIEQEDVSNKITKMYLDTFESLTKGEKQEKIRALVDAQVFLLYKLQHDYEGAGDGYDKNRMGDRLGRSLTRLRFSFRAIEYQSGGEISAILAKHGFERMPKVQSSYDSLKINGRDGMGDIALSKDESVLRDLLTKVYEFQTREYSDIHLKTSILKLANSKLEDGKQKKTLEREAENWLMKRPTMEYFNPFSVEHWDLSDSVPNFPKQEWEGEIPID